MTGASQKAKDPTDTPMMRQYLAAKDQYRDALLFYRMGDFYEMFFEDAVVAAAALDLTLTSRNKNDPDPIPMCGVPHHAAVSYISRLIEKGFKVAVCEQMEDPAKARGLVKREVVRLITPGVVLDEENLEAKANNFLAAVMICGHGAVLAAIDASTCEFRGTRVDGLGSLVSELYRLEPREILATPEALESLRGIGDILPGCCLSTLEEDRFTPQVALPALAALIGQEEIEGLVAQDPDLARAAGAAAFYVQRTRPMGEVQVQRFVRYTVSDFLILDETTKSHLELVRTGAGEKKGSLLWLIDKTRTAMGGRLLRQWINYPLCDVARIRRRLDRVDLFFRDSRFRSDVATSLSRLSDVERLASRIGMGVATPRDLGSLRTSLLELPELDTLLDSCPEPDAEEVLGGRLDRAEALASALDRALVDEPPTTAKDGGIFREGFDARLDELTSTVRSAKDFIAALETRERERTGIASLKVTYNRVFGYSINVTKANLKHVPDDYERKQTIAGGERYVTAELEDWESRVLSADDRRCELEAELFASLLGQVAQHVPRLLALGQRLAELDCAQGLAEVARVADFVRPEVDDREILELEESRHPLVEALQPQTPFVPNDVRLDPDKEQLLIITGPNMAGKSTVMRQVALIVVLAQMGSFVPARRARIGVCDRVFTRVGASDNIARGASTFMVEMKETSAILRHATRRSLVILDEVGRGTSTYDGLSIAWAVGEYLHDVVKARTLFATHYHELVELAKQHPRVVNLHVAAEEYGEDVVFLRKLVEGGTSHSFGIAVGKMAGLPELVVLRAKEVLAGLEEERPSEKAQMPKVAKRAAGHPAQLDLFAKQRPSEADRVLKQIDVDRLTPLEALALLARLKSMVG
ncbi:MAG: DNA mismatch repair protein MutS [Myxococcota bacterium]|jgi:DNA mismatch repair protein MutS|nr:DNA mismatch repair protein MutS [Myxococcota bacterium]